MSVLKSSFFPIHELVRINPNSKDLESEKDAINCSRHTKEGIASYSLKQYAAAREHLSNAIKYAEYSPSLLLKRAYCNHRLDDFYDAIADTGKVLKVEMDNIEALELRGGAYYILGTTISGFESLCMCGSLYLVVLMSIRSIR